MVLLKYIKPELDLKIIMLHHQNNYVGYLSMMMLQKVLTF